MIVISFLGNFLDVFKKPPLLVIFLMITTINARPDKPLPQSKFSRGEDLVKHLSEKYDIFAVEDGPILLEVGPTTHPINIDMSSWSSGDVLKNSLELLSETVAEMDSSRPAVQKFQMDYDDLIELHSNELAHSCRVQLQKYMVAVEARPERILPAVPIIGIALGGMIAGAVITDIILDAQFSKSDIDEKLSTLMEAILDDMSNIGAEILKSKVLPLILEKKSGTGGENLLSTLFGNGYRGSIYEAIPDLSLGLLEIDIKEVIKKSDTEYCLEGQVAGPIVPLSTLHNLFRATHFGGFDGNHYTAPIVPPTIAIKDFNLESQYIVDMTRCKKLGIYHICGKFDKPVADCNIFEQSGCLYFTAENGKDEFPLERRLGQDVLIATPFNNSALIYNDVKIPIDKKVFAVHLPKGAYVEVKLSGGETRRVEGTGVLDTQLIVSFPGSDLDVNIFDNVEDGISFPKLRKYHDEIKASLITGGISASFVALVAILVIVLAFFLRRNRRVSDEAFISLRNQTKRWLRRLRTKHRNLREQFHQWLPSKNRPQRAADEEVTEFETDVEDEEKPKQNCQPEVELEKGRSIMIKTPPMGSKRPKKEKKTAAINTKTTVIDETTLNPPTIPFILARNPIPHNSDAEFETDNDCQSQYSMF